MSIRTENELKKFEDAINRCRNTVFVVTPDGTEYDLKAPEDHKKGMAALFNADDSMDAEIFATTHEDEMVMIDYKLHNAKAA